MVFAPRRHNISNLVQGKHPQNSCGIGAGQCSQQKTCNISETWQDRIKLLLTTNRKSHTRFRLVPKSTTLDDLERPIRILFQNTCVFRGNRKNLNEGEDGPILSATKM